MLEHYTKKLKTLENVDEEFLTTVDSSRRQSKSGAVSPNQLLRTIYIPKDLKQLSGFLPQKNYG